MSGQSLSPSESVSLLWSAVVKICLFIFLLGALILGAAGTFLYWEVYAYIILILIPMVFILNFLLRESPQLLKHRMIYKERMASQKKVLWLSGIPMVGIYLIPGLDRRFGWSDVPWPLVILALGMVLMGYLLVINVFRYNAYASRIVELQEDQRVISTGPYGIIRHPMYAGATLLYLATPLALGSWWGILPALLILPVLILRIRGEESFLRESLKGYKEYCNRIRFRLIPHIW